MAEKPEKSQNFELKRKGTNFYEIGEPCVDDALYTLSVKFNFVDSFQLLVGQGEVATSMKWKILFGVRPLLFSLIEFNLNGDADLPTHLNDNGVSIECRCSPNTFTEFLNASLLGFTVTGKKSSGPRVIFGNSDFELSTFLRKGVHSVTALLNIIQGEPDRGDIAFPMMSVKFGLKSSQDFIAGGGNFSEKETLVKGLGLPAPASLPTEPFTSQRIPEIVVTTDEERANQASHDASLPHATANEDPNAGARWENLDEKIAIYRSEALPQSAAAFEASRARMREHEAAEITNCRKL